jgi:hypothetical protein
MIPHLIYLLNYHLLKCQSIMIQERPQYTHQTILCDTFSIIIIIIYQNTVPMSFMQKKEEIIPNYLYKIM